MLKEYETYINEKAEEFLNISDEERIRYVNGLLQLCDFPHEKYVVAMMYVYGPRPAELMIIGKGRFKIKDGSVRLRLPTVKRGVVRAIILDIETTPFLNIIANYVENNDVLIPKSWSSPTNVNAVFKKISKKNGQKRLSPYIFRKFRLSHLALELDASAADLQNWKGARDLRSVDPYIRMKPIKKFRRLIR